MCAVNVQLLPVKTPTECQNRSQTETKPNTGMLRDKDHKTDRVSAQRKIPVK